MVVGERSGEGGVEVPAVVGARGGVWEEGGAAPVMPGCVMMSRRPPAATATTGRALAIASSTTNPSVSLSDGITNTSALAYADNRSSPRSRPCARPALEHQDRHAWSSPQLSRSGWKFGPLCDDEPALDHQSARTTCYSPPSKLCTCLAGKFPKNHNSAHQQWLAPGSPVTGHRDVSTTQRAEAPAGQRQWSSLGCILAVILQTRQPNRQAGARRCRGRPTCARAYMALGESKSTLHFSVVLGKGVPFAAEVPFAAGTKDLGQTDAGINVGRWCYASPPFTAVAKSP